MLTSMRKFPLFSFLGLKNITSSEIMDVYQQIEHDSGLLDFDSTFVGQLTRMIYNGEGKYIFVTQMMIGFILSYTSIIGDLVESAVYKKISLLPEYISVYCMYIFKQLYRHFSLLL